MGSIISAITGGDEDQSNQVQQPAQNYGNQNVNYSVRGPGPYQANNLNWVGFVFYLEFYIYFQN